ncbi:DNA-directed RNA polymerase I subunit RPA49-like isoform X2 [Lineus longissimus]|uniref:DNA-directed RNA polymerase I subunit RPA49-like isoform X2 n=1 Tax=Lineus longissimus TaxID=88925 RepID=UPI002B4D2359
MSAPMVHVSKEKYHAVIAKYANGCLKRSASDDIHHVWYRHKQGDDERKKHKEMLVAETDRLDYSGSIMRRKGSGVSDSYIGEFDRRTGKVRICSTSTFHLTPKLPGSDEQPSPEKIDFRSLSFVDKSDAFVDAFGSSKKKRAVDSRRRNLIADSVLEAAVGAALNQSMSNSRNESLLDVSTSTKDTSDVIPPHDATAMIPEQVYKIDDIISHQEYDALQPYIDPFVNVSHSQIEEWRNKEIYGRYILDHLAALPLQEHRRQKRATYLLYLYYMMSLYHRRASELKKRDPLPPDWPEVIKMNLLEKFTFKVGGDGTKVVRCMPARLKDKLLSYMIVLCLHMDEFYMPFDDFQKDSKVGVSRLTDHIRALGCKIETETFMVGKQQSIGKNITLPLPLKFPERLKGGKPKGKR